MLTRTIHKQTSLVRTPLVCTLPLIIRATKLQNTLGSFDIRILLMYNVVKTTILYHPVMVNQLRMSAFNLVVLWPWS